MCIKQGKTNWKFLLFVLVLAVIVCGGILWWQKEELKNSQEPVACTQEAKICPDGSAVGRTGPNCEFAECPVVSDKTAGWKTYVDSQNGFEFKYPGTFGADVWRPVFWPPTTTVISINEDPIVKGCPDFPLGIQGATQEMIKINNIDWTFYWGAEGAMGSSYASYCYVIKKDQNYYVVYFEIRNTNGCGENCGPYCGTQYEQECLDFNLARDVEKPIGLIMSTFQFLK